MAAIAQGPELPCGAQLCLRARPPALTSSFPVSHPVPAAVFLLCCPVTCPAFSTLPLHLHPVLCPHLMNLLYAFAFALVCSLGRLWSVPGDDIPLGIRSPQERSRGDSHDGASTLYVILVSFLVFFSNLF